MDGKNIADFVDPDIDRKLAELEREEALLMQEAEIRNDDGVLKDYSKTQNVLDELHSRMRQRRLMNRLNKNRNHAPTLRKKGKKLSEVEQKLDEQGKDSSKIRARSTSRSSTVLAKRKRDASMDSEGGRASSAVRAASARSSSLMKGLPSMAVANEVEKKRRKRMRFHELQGKKGEADRHIPDLKPKHLYSGKRGIGKTDRR